MHAWILGLAGVLCAGSWLFCLVAYVGMLRNRAPGVGVGQLLMRGTMSFDADNFTGAGQAHQRRFVRGFAVFFAGIALAVCGVALAIAAQSQAARPATGAPGPAR